MDVACYNVEPNFEIDLITGKNEAMVDWSSFLIGNSNRDSSGPLKTVLQDIREGKAILLDVRTLKEWDKGHLQDAVNIPIDELEQRLSNSEELDELDKNKIIYCHCESGVRAMLAEKLLQPLGYELRALSQNYRALIDHGFPPADLNQENS